MSCPRKITVTPEKKFRSSLKAQSPVCIGRYAPSCVRATVFGSSGRCSSPVRAIVMCSWARYLIVTVPLPTHVYINGYCI